MSLVADFGQGGLPEYWTRVLDSQGEEWKTCTGAVLSGLGKRFG